MLSIPIKLNTFIICYYFDCEYCKADILCQSFLIDKFFQGNIMLSLDIIYLSSMIHQRKDIMITFLIALAALIGGYMIYGKIVDNIFKPTDAPTPAITKADGVDFIVLPTWKVFMIQLLLWRSCRCTLGSCRLPLDCLRHYLRRSCPRLPLRYDLTARGWQITA